MADPSTFYRNRMHNVMKGVGLQRPIEQRRNDQARAQTMHAGIQEIFGQVPINGVGEVSFEVFFPVTFIEQPAVYGGGALTTKLYAGSFPTWSVGAANWITEQRADALYWVGATIIVVVTGQTEQQSVANWIVRGPALRNPVTP